MASGAREGRDAEGGCARRSLLLAIMPIWLPLSLLFLALLVVAGPFITLVEEVARPGWHARKLRTRGRCMAWDEWAKLAGQGRGTTILELPTIGWSTARLWWTPDTVEEPEASRWLDDPTPVLRPGPDPPTVALCEEQLDVDKGQAQLVRWGNGRRIQTSAQELLPELKLIRVESWRLCFPESHEQRESEGEPGSSGS